MAILGPSPWRRPPLSTLTPLTSPHHGVAPPATPDGHPPAEANSEAMSSVASPDPTWQMRSAVNVSEFPSRRTKVKAKLTLRTYPERASIFLRVPCQRENTFNPQIRSCQWCLWFVNTQVIHLTKESRNRRLPRWSDVHVAPFLSVCQ